MNAIKTITATVAAIAVAATLAACGTSEVPEPTPTASATATAEPTTPSPTDPETPAVVIPTEPGAVVTADLIDQARAEGVQVYVSPNGDGSGTVITDTAVDPILADAGAIPGTVGGVEDMRVQGQMLSDIAVATDDAGTGVIFIIAAGAVSADGFAQDGYTSLSNKTAAGFTPVAGSKSTVLGAAEAYAAANPGTLVIDLTA